MGKYPKIIKYRGWIIRVRITKTMGFAIDTGIDGPRFPIGLHRYFKAEGWQHPKSVRQLWTEKQAIDAVKAELDKDSLTQRLEKGGLRGQASI